MALPKQYLKDVKEMAKSKKAKVVPVDTFKEIREWLRGRGFRWYTMYRNSANSMKLLWVKNGAKNAPSGLAKVIELNWATVSVTVEKAHHSIYGDTTPSVYVRMRPEFRVFDPRTAKDRKYKADIRREISAAARGKGRR